MNSRHTRRTAVTAAGLLGAALAAPSHAAASAALDRPLAQAARTHAGGSLQVIARLHGGELTSAQETQLRALGADVYRRLPIIHSVALRVPAHRLAALAALPFVERLSSDGTVSKCDAFTTGSSLATTAWQKPYSITGQGVTVAVLDSGINAKAQDLQTPPALALSLLGLPAMSPGPRVVGSVSFAVDPSGKTLDPNDQCGHGTHVAGIIAGDGAASYGPLNYQTFFGVAPLSNLVNVRVLNAQGGGSVSQVVAGIQWVLANQSKYGIKVINLSLGHPVGESYTTDPLCQAAEAAWRSGIVVVCAAGNEGRTDATQDQPDNEGWGTAYGSIQSPGNDPFVITVGATKSIDGSRADDKIATYSSRGPSRLDLVCKPDLVAPGNKVISLDVKGSTLDLANGGANRIPLSTYQYLTLSNTATSDRYFQLSGTSMAAPVVAGAAALLLQANPSLTPDTIKARLMLSADKPAAWNDANGNYDACTYGAGYVDIPAALTNTTVITGEYAISPSLSIDPSGNVAVNDDHALWGKTTVDTSHALWGKSALWGTSGVYDLHALWGSHALWGCNELASSHALWGCSVWSDHALWGCSSDAVDLTNTVLTGE